VLFIPNKAVKPNQAPPGPDPAAPPTPELAKVALPDAEASGCSTAQSQQTPGPSPRTCAGQASGEDVDPLELGVGICSWFNPVCDAADVALSANKGDAGGVLLGVVGSCLSG
jgi:hypothetical protein